MTVRASYLRVFVHVHKSFTKMSQMKGEMNQLNFFFAILFCETTTVTLDLPLGSNKLLSIYIMLNKETAKGQ